MSDQQTLLLVLIIVYLSECFVWVGHGAVAFRTVWRKFQPVDPPNFPGSDRGGWALLNPFPPFGCVFVCYQWPVVVTVDQVGPQTGQSINFREMPATEALVLPWAAASKLEATGSKLSLAGEPMMRLPDDVAANHFCGVIGQLAKATPEVRHEQIVRAVARSFDTAEIKRRVEQFRRRTAFLGTFSLLFFCLLFVLLPLSIYLQRFSHTVYRVLPMLLLTWFAVMWLYFRAHRRLLPAERLARWKGLVTMIFAPTAAIRSRDVISRHLLAGYDPVAVAAVLFDDRTFAGFATRALRDLQIPLPMKLPAAAAADGPADPTRPPLGTPSSSSAGDEAPALDPSTDFRKRLAAEVAAVMQKRGIDVAALTQTPRPADPAHRSYCPRCRLEYLVETGTCRDCGELKLERFA